MNTEHGTGLPAYLRPVNLGLVFVGGALGVLARELLMMLVPDVSGMPVAVFIANLLGALLLGLLLEGLARSAMSEARRLPLRLLLGSGLMGGFTTYSALAAAVMLLWVDGSIGFALGYGLATVVLGALATWSGVALGAKFARGTAAGDADV